MTALSDIASLCVRRPYLAAVLNLLIIIAGASALAGVEVRELPDVDRPVVSVRGDLPGASPETLDAEVTSIVEGAVARVNGVVQVRSSSEEDNFRIRIVFNPSVNLIDAANDVREAVARVRRRLPDRLENLTVVKADADAGAIVRLAVYSDSLKIEDVTRIARDEVVPALTAIKGVADVEVSGARERVVRVVIDPLRLASYQLSIADVVATLRAARLDVPAGSFKSADQDIIVRADASVEKPAAIERLLLRDNVRLGDIATVYFAAATPINYVRVNGRSVITLGVIRRAKANTVAISDRVSQRIAQLNQRLRAITIVRTSDDAIFIRGAIGEVLLSLAIAVTIVVGVIALFIGHLRTALIPAVAIPVALIGTIAALWLFGFSINLVTLLALVLAAGIVVDDAIVVLENIQRLRAQGAAAGAASVIGTRQVFFAVIATTATLVAVFVPISFLPSKVGRLFAEFGFVLAVAVMVSSFVALTLCPMLASRLGTPGRAPASRDGEDGPRRGLIAAAWAGCGLAFAKAYDATIAGVIRAPLIVVGLSAIIGSAGAITYTTLGEELVPKEDRGRLNLWMVGPDGTGLDYIDRQMEWAERLLRPHVESGLITTLDTISGAYDPNRGRIIAPLKPWSERSVGEGELVRALNAELRKLPGARARIYRGNSLGLRNAGGGLKFALIGANYDVLAQAAQKFRAAMERELPKIASVRVEFRATQPQVSLHVDRARASDLGVDLALLAQTLRVLVDDTEIGDLTIDDQRVPIIVQARAGAVDDPSDLNNLFVRGGDGRMVALAQVITFKERAVAAELDRHGQRRAIEIRGDPSDDLTLREAVAQVRALAAKVLPDGVSVLMLDEAADLDETSSGVMITFAVALLVVFLVLVAQFESITSGLIVILTVPFGIAAAVFALALSGTTINIYSQIGVLMLIGIMAKNAILLVEFADQERDRGASVVEAARTACRIRLRPIVMTMLSTILAGLPLVLAEGPGAEARAAIGWVVVGGLGLAALVTLFLTPALYVLLAGLSSSRAQATETLEHELDRAARAEVH
ncbi:MAG: efflux RND transporter permease subunit [Pseudomonadota bacterium]